MIVKKLHKKSDSKALYAEKKVSIEIILHQNDSNNNNFGIDDQVNN